MSSHACPRCGAVTDPVLPGGLCVTCHGRQDDTRQSVSVVADAPTPSVDPAAAGTLTFATPADTTVTRDGEAGGDPFGVLPADGYQLGHLLGEGGMGRVYRAVGRATGQVVAVKKLRPERYTPSLLARLVREARILARLNHPNVVRLHHFVPAPGDPHLVMEFVDGQSLAARLTDGNGLPPDTAARLVAAAARGVQAAHDAGVIHRDLKPGNLLVSEADQVKVSDFGLGMLTDADDGLTMTDQPIGGTPGFAAPEQVAEGGVCDPRTDVWGLGACLHACLVGQPPYPSGRANLTRVLSDPLVPPRSVNPAVPAVLDAIVLRCLEKDPANRYQSAAELADDLDRYRRGESTVAKPLPWAARTWRRVRGIHRGLVVAWAVAAAAGVIALLATPRPPREQTPIRPLVATGEDDQTRAEHVGALVAGDRPVNLIGEDGAPLLPARWRLGKTAVEVDAAELAFRIEAIRDVMLDLSPPIPHPRYTVEVELRFDYAGPGPQNRNGLAGAFVGAYLASAELAGAGGARLLPLYAVTYKDYDQNAALGKKPTPRRVTGRLAAVVTTPGVVEPDIPSGDVGGIDFLASDVTPGPWRVLKFEVDGGGVRAGWAGGPREVVSWITPVRGDTARVFADLLRPHLPGGTAFPPPYSFGVWCKRAGLSIKNCVVTPRTE